MQAGRAGNRFLAAAVGLLGLPCLIVAAGLLLRVMHGAGEIGTHLMDGSHVVSLGDDGVRGELAHFELRALGLVLRLWFFRHKHTWRTKNDIGPECAVTGKSYFEGSVMI